MPSSASNRISSFEWPKTSRKSWGQRVHCLPRATISSFASLRIEMALFFSFGKSIDLPAKLHDVSVHTRDLTAWQFLSFQTVELTSPMVGLRVHTADKPFGGREASAEAGAWCLIGDVVLTSSEIASSRSLPADDPTRMIAFTHTSEAYMSIGTVLNIGLASPKFGGSGGGFQAEYVDGPMILFSPLLEKHWHGGVAHA